MHDYKEYLIANVVIFDSCSFGKEGRREMGCMVEVNQLLYGLS